MQIQCGTQDKQFPSVFLIRIKRLRGNPGWTPASDPAKWTPVYEHYMACIEWSNCIVGSRELVAHIESTLLDKQKCLYLAQSFTMGQLASQMRLDVLLQMMLSCQMLLPSAKGQLMLRRDSRERVVQRVRRVKDEVC